MILCRLAKAACRSSIRSARGLVADVGTTVAKNLSPGLLDMARCSQSNSERDTHRVLDSYGLALPIPLTKLDTKTDGCDVQFLRLSDWLTFILQHNAFHTLCGLRGPDMARQEKILSSFWGKFRHDHSDHPIYNMATNQQLVLHRTLPIVLRGDEGRGAKRSAFMVLQWHGLLGLGTHPQKRREKQLNMKRKYVKHNLNFRGHTYTNRFMHGCLPKHWYADDKDHVFTALLAAAADEACHLASEGVKDPITGEQFWCMMIGVVGDWPFLQKSGSLNRTFNHVQKRLNLRHPPAGVCHLCQAGQVNIPYEQISTRRPMWLRTLNVQSPFETPSPFLNVPHADGRFAELWKFDAFHCFHIGLGKHFLGSVLALLSETYPQGNVDDRFDALTCDYLAFCRAHKCNAYVKKLSKELISWPTTHVYPIGSWHKGDLTTSLLRFVQVHFQNEDFSQNHLLSMSYEATISINKFFEVLYSRELFLERDDAKLAANLGMQFLRRFASLAELSLQQGRALFVIQPKAHAFHHILVSLYRSCEAQAVSFTLNPLGFSTQCDEDFVGRPSRLSRRTRVGKVQVRRVIQRYLKGAYHQWLKMGYINRAAKRGGGK